VNNTRLLSLLEIAHYECCKRSNISSHVLVETYAGSNYTPQAIAAAISTFGDFHAPVDKTLSLLLDPERIEKVQIALSHKIRIPGWGSAFIKNRPDPIFNELALYLKENHPEEFGILKEITGIIHEHGKHLYPNAAGFTAIVGKILDYSPRTIHFLLVSCRLRGWLKTIHLYETEGEYFFVQNETDSEKSKIFGNREGAEVEGSVAVFAQGQALAGSS
jgi:citrate synthase